MGGYGAGQSGPVGGGTFDHSQGVGVGTGATGRPGHDPVEPSRMGGKFSSIEQIAVGDVEDRVAVVAGVRGTPTTNGWEWTWRSFVPSS